MRFSLLTVVVAVQNYITAILIFLVIEMLMTWGFYGRHRHSWQPIPNSH
jgi:hypothetical protein